jgi:hypothetical protein
VPIADFSGSPGLAELSAFITRRAAEEQVAVAQLALAQSAQIVAQSEAQAQAAGAHAQEQANHARAAIESKKTEIRAAIDGARVTIREQIGVQKALAGAEEKRARAALDKTIEDQKQAAVAAAGKEADATLTFGRDEATRVRNSASGVKGRIQALAATKASAFKAGSNKARQAGRDTIQKGALDAAAKVQKNGDAAAAEALASSAKLSQRLRDEGRKLADSLKPSTAQSDKSIRAATSSAVRRIDASCKKLLGQLETVRSQTSTSLDKHKQEVGSNLHGDGETTAKAIRAAGKAAAHKMGELAAGRARTIDKAKQDALAELVRVTAGKTLPQQAIVQLQASAGEIFKKAGADARSVLRDETQQALGKLAQAGQAVSAPLGNSATQAIEVAHGVGDKVTTSVGEITKTMAHDGKGTFADQKLTNDRVVKSMHDDLGKEVQNAQQGWTKQRQSFETDLRSKVDNSIAAQRVVETRLPAQLDGAAKKAADDAEGSILSGIWNGIVSFAKGLAVFVVAVLVVLVIVLMFVSGVGEALLIAIAIVSVCMLIYGVVTAFIRRWSDLEKMGIGDAPWYIKVLAVAGIAGIAVADVFGVGALLEGIFGVDLVTGRELTKEERAQRITEGVLTIGFMFLLRGLVKGRTGQGEVPDPKIEPGEKPPAPEPKVGDPDPVLSSKLSGIRSSLSDPRAVEAFDDMFQRMGKNPAKMERALDGMGKKAAKDGMSLEQLLIDEWVRKHPDPLTPPNDATIARVDVLVDRANQLKAEVDAYTQSNPDVKGPSEWTAKLDGAINRLNQIRADVNKALPKQSGQPDGLRGEAANLDGIEAELRAAQQAKGVTQVNANKSFKTSSGDKVDVDVVADGGKTWIESKSVEPFGKNSSNWPEMEAQAGRLLDAARTNPVDGVLPRVVFRFSKGVSSEVASALRRMGIEVEGKEVDPLPDLPVPAVPPKDDDRKSQKAEGGP